MKSSLDGTYYQNRFQLIYCVDGPSSLYASSVGASGISHSHSRIGHFWGHIIESCSESKMPKKINKLLYNVNFLFLLKITFVNIANSLGNETVPNYEVVFANLIFCVIRFINPIHKFIG